MAVLEEEPPPVRKPRAAPPTLSPHFVLLPAPSGSLLLKAVAVRELLMPCDLGTGNQPVEASLQTLASHLHQVSLTPAFSSLWCGAEFHCNSIIIKGTCIIDSAW